jgi:beta-1,2-mannosidase
LTKIIPVHRLLLGSIALASAVVVSVASLDAQPQQQWMLGPFAKADHANPCLEPDQSSTFVCPIRGTDVGWEAKDVFNPAAVVRGDTVYLFYRAQDRIGKPAGTSRIGMAWSADGMHFLKRRAPVLYPDNDVMQQYEWEGGCEDPRIVQDERGNYVMTYTAFDGKTARLAVATSGDLLRWKKEGLAFADAKSGVYRDRWSKSGAIVSRWVHGTPVAARINGRYWMYWGESNLNLATSNDLVRWTPLEDPGGELTIALAPRPGQFDSWLVEPGPPAMLTDSGIVLLYNSCNHRTKGDPGLPGGTYAAGQAIFAKDNPARALGRSSTYFLRPEKSYELTGQVHNVCFIEGLVSLRGTWLLYYGTADSRIAVATSLQQQIPAR